MSEPKSVPRGHAFPSRPVKTTRGQTAPQVERTRASSTAAEQREAGLHADGDTLGALWTAAARSRRRVFLERLARDEERRRC